MEWWDSNKAVLHPDVELHLSSIKAVANELHPLLSIEGIMIQDKWVSISIHISPLCRIRYSENENTGAIEKFYAH